MKLLTKSKLKTTHFQTEVPNEISGRLKSIAASISIKLRKRITPPDCTTCSRILQEAIESVCESQIYLVVAQDFTLECYNGWVDLYEDQSEMIERIMWTLKEHDCCE